MALNNSQHNFIMKIYSDRRSLAERALSERNKEIAEKLPEYTALCEETASLAIAATKARISGDDAEEQRCLNKMNAISFDKTDLLLKNGYPQNYLELWYECPDCKDTGYIDNKKCHCFEQIASSLIRETNQLAGFLEEASFDSLSFEYYEGDDLIHYKSSVDQCKSFVKNFGFDYSNFLFYGTVGTGKSYLTACVAKELIEQGRSVIYFSASELFRILSDIMFMRGEKASLEFLRENIYNCDLLIIDDLGTELTNNATGSQFFSLINERALKKKPVFISTNLSLAELQERYTDRIFSRILSLYSLHGINGPDIRRIKRFQKK